MATQHNPNQQMPQQPQQQSQIPEEMPRAPSDGAIQPQAPRPFSDWASI